MWQQQKLNQTKEIVTIKKILQTVNTQAILNIKFTYVIYKKRSIKGSTTGEI